MFILEEPDSAFSSLSECLKQKTAEFFRELNLSPKNLRLNPNQSPKDLGLGQEFLGVLNIGNLKVEVGSDALYFYEPGDLIGLDEESATSDLRTTSEFAWEVSAYPKRDFFEAVQKDSKVFAAFQSILSLRFQIFQKMIALKTRQRKTDSEIEVRSFEPKDLILRQGETGEEVFTMLSGSAEVLVDGIHVGEIHEEQIFGALAALTEGKRTATVQANSECSVLVVPKSQFLDLIESRPKTVLSLLNEMARIIASMNQEVVQLNQKIKGS